MCLHGCVHTCLLHQMYACMCIKCFSNVIQKIFCFTGTFCGVFRRQALDRGAMMLNVDKIVTGQILSGMVDVFWYIQTTVICDLSDAEWFFLRNFFVSLIQKANSNQEILVFH